MSEFRGLRCSGGSSRSGDWCSCYLSGGLFFLLLDGLLLLCWRLLDGGGGRGVVVGCSILLCSSSLWLLGRDGSAGISLLVLRHGWIGSDDELGGGREQRATAKSRPLAFERDWGLPSYRFRLALSTNLQNNGFC